MFDFYQDVAVIGLIMIFHLLSSNKILKKLFLFWLYFIIFLLFSFFVFISTASWQDVEDLVARINFSTILIDDSNLVIQKNYDQVDTKIVQLIDNPFFNLGLDSWSYIGHVAHKFDESFGNYLEIGYDESSNLLQENCISQDLNPSDTNFNLLVEYQFFLNEALPGFDSTPFVILIDNVVIFQEFLTLSSNELQISTIPVAIQNKERIELKLCAGNRGDRLNSSWLQVYQVSTLVAPINSDATLKISSKKGHFTVVYTLNGSPTRLTDQKNVLLSFDQPLDNNSLEIEYDNELLKIPVIFYENLPLAVENPRHCFFEDDQLLLNFFSDENKSLIFQLGCKDEFDLHPIWVTIAKYTNLPAIFPIDLERSNCPFDNCFISTQLVQDCLDSDLLMIRSCDASGLCSNGTISFLMQSCQELLPSYTNQPVLINEVMFNPLGDDKKDWYEGEWIELYNPNWVDLDLDGYQIKDEVGWEINLNQNSCDANHDINDDGETVIPALGFLVAFARGRAIFNNSSDSVYLFDTEGQLIDQVTYIGSSLENLTYGRFPDGEKNWYSQMQSSSLEPNLH